jgi:hypothetical protein
MGDKYFNIKTQYPYCLIFLFPLLPQYSATQAKIMRAATRNPTTPSTIINIMVFSSSLEVGVAVVASLGTE